MPASTRNCAEPTVDGESGTDDGCAFILEVEARATSRRSWCGGPRRPGSAYCEAHHAHCHLPSDSLAERRRIMEIEALAEAVGGRSGRPARRPPQRFLRRMDRVSRATLRPERS
jgi:hypothetical protein